VTHPQRTLDHYHHQAEFGRQVRGSIFQEKRDHAWRDPRIPDFTGQFITM
jgi:hypothetical protein